ncbi:MAG TPA: ester cyclase [Candidatus Methylacidiphilales bacterium]|nr:ester cyclase [Candidatus Methylacidiphilales bacterium]
MSTKDASLDGLLRRWFEEVWNKGRIEIIDEMLSPDCVAEGILGEDGKPVRGPEGFKPFFKKFRGAFPDIHISILETLSEGNRIAARCRVQGTHTGDHLGIPASQKKVDITGMCLGAFKDGMMVEAWNNFDFLSLYQQVGLV